MPQMAPMNWMILMIYFVLIFLFINTLNYFSFIYKIKSKTLTKKKKLINWKW